MTDDKGNVLAVGDEVRATYIDQSRGAAMWMNLGTIVRFARTRAVVKFYGATGEWAVGPECLRSVKADKRAADNAHYDAQQKGAT